MKYSALFKQLILFQIVNKFLNKKFIQFLKFLNKKFIRTTDV